MTEQTNAPISSALRARGIGVSFGGLRALEGVDVDVAPGEIVGIIGPNGAGKTTLFDCLSGFVPCDGRVWIGGTDVTSMVPHKRAAAGLGRSFQDARLFPTMTVLDALRVSCELHARGSKTSSALGLPKARRSDRETSALVLDLIESLGLSAYRDKLIRELSTGTRRIVDLACMLAQRPAVLLLDEPSSGIAQREAEALGALLRNIQARTGCAMLLIEHDMPLLLGLAHRVYALETGSVIAAGAPADVVNHPSVVHSYLGADPTAINRSDAAPAVKTRKPRTPRKALPVKKTATKAPVRRSAAKTPPKRAKTDG
jgi:ABC-type branched-subunit amino acid transport system ATPase component